MSESQTTETATEAPEVLESLNQWLLPLPAERMTILQEDKWMLDEAAFAAGHAIGRQEVDHLEASGFAA